MASFTPITAGVDWQALSIVNEIVLAWRERVAVASNNPIGAVMAAGDDIQDKDVWEDMQLAVDGWATTFVDHTTSPFGGDASVPKFTLASFRTEAGLNSSGWKRATEWVPGAVDGTWQNDVTFSYGVMQAGDIIGPWIFDDLQKALSTLKWTERSGSSTSGAGRSATTGGSPADCATARTTHLSNWAAAGWVGGLNTMYRAAGRRQDSLYYFQGYRRRGSPSYTGISTVLAHTADAYAKAALPTNIGVGTFTPTFLDVDGLGLVLNELYLTDTFTSATIATRTGALIDPSTNSPVADIPLSCPYAPDTAQGCQLDVNEIVLKWAFTNSD